MSSAFVKKIAIEQLNEIEPTIYALPGYLRQKYSHIQVQQSKKIFNQHHSGQVYGISKELIYIINGIAKSDIIPGFLKYVG